MLALCLSRPVLLSVSCSPSPSPSSCRPLFSSSPTSLYLLALPLSTPPSPVPLALSSLSLSRSLPFSTLLLYAARWRLTGFAVTDGLAVGLYFWQYSGHEKFKPRIVRFPWTRGAVLTKIAIFWKSADFEKVMKRTNPTFSAVNTY